MLTILFHHCFHWEEPSLVLLWLYIKGSFKETACFTFLISSSSHFSPCTGVKEVMRRSGWIETWFCCKITNFPSSSFVRITLKKIPITINFNYFVGKMLYTKIIKYRIIISTKGRKQEVQHKQQRRRAYLFFHILHFLTLNLITEINNDSEIKQKMAEIC